MNSLEQLPIRDLRPRLRVLDRPKCRRKREGAVSSVTLHYNGPAVAGLGDLRCELRQITDVDLPNHQERLRADGLMYHFVVFSDGSIWQTRDLDLQAWHCGVPDGNEHSIAVHLPIGGTQDATTAMWSATTRLFDALIKRYTLPGRHVVKGHQEWKATACPGPLLMSRLEAWRTAELGVPFSSGIFRVRDDIGVANVREGPSRTFPVALHGQAIMWPGDFLSADAVVEGERIGDEARWAYRSDGLGFVHLSLLTSVG
jgi:hypothetical protein